MQNRPAPAAQRGFTLLELMIVVVIVAILAAWAIASYSDYIRKARRADAQQRISQIALAQERYRAEHPGYTADWGELLGDPDVADSNATGKYFDWPDVTIDNAADPKTYTITATAVGSQAEDHVGATACSSLTLDEEGNRTPVACWAK